MKQSKKNIRKRKNTLLKTYPCVIWRQHILHLRLSAISCKGKHNTNSVLNSSPFNIMSESVFVRSFVKICFCKDLVGHVFCIMHVSSRQRFWSLNSWMPFDGMKNGVNFLSKRDFWWNFITTFFFCFIGFSN